MVFLDVHPGGFAFSEGGGAACTPVTLGSSSTAQHLVNSWCRDYGYCQAFRAPGGGRYVSGGVMKPLFVDFDARKGAFMETRPDSGVLERRRVARTSAAGGRSPLFWFFFSHLFPRKSRLRPESTRRKRRFERCTLQCSIYPQRLRRCCSGDLYLMELLLNSPLCKIQLSIHKMRL